MQRMLVLLLFFSFPLGAADNRPDAKPAKHLPLAPAVLPETLPEGFLGHDFGVIHAALKKKPRPVKSEFETQAAYADRLAQWLAAPLVGKLKPADKVVFSASLPMQKESYEPVRYEYDADSQQFTLWARPDCLLNKGLTVRHESRSAGSYVGANAYGARKTVSKTTVKADCLLISPEIYIQKETFKASPYDAIVMTFTTRVAVLASLEEAVAEEDSMRDAPTLSNPADILYVIRNLRLKIDAVWLYNSVTGKVYLKCAGRDAGGELYSYVKCPSELANDGR